MNNFMNSPYGPFECISYCLCFPNEFSAQQIISDIREMGDKWQRPLAAHLKAEMINMEIENAELEGFLSEFPDLAPEMGEFWSYRCPNDSPYCPCDHCQAAYAND